MAEAEHHEIAARDTRSTRAPAGEQSAQITAGGLLPAHPSLLPAPYLTNPLLKGRGNAPARVALLQQMQGTYGNRAVARFLQRHPAPAGAQQERPLPPQRRTLAIQRCGGEVHAGCDCEREDALPLQTTRAPESRPAVAVQRGPPDYPAMAAGGLSPGSPYATLPQPLLETLRRSLETRVDPTPDPAHPGKNLDPGNRNLDNAFWGGRPSSFEDALNRLGTAAIQAVRQIYDRAGSDLWAYIKTIKNLWPGAARGFQFEATNQGGLQSWLKTAPKFCKDTKIGESAHGGAPCWRETVSGSAGLHVCLAGGGANDIHIDIHQDVKGKGRSLRFNPLILISPLGGAWASYFGDPLLGGGESELGPLCQYDAAQIPGHLKDWKLGVPPTIFERLDRVQSWEKSLRAEKIEPLPSRLAADRVKLLAALDNVKARIDGIMTYARNLAVQGEPGEQKGEADSLLPYTVKKAEEELADIDARYTALMPVAAPAPGATPASPPPPPPPPAP